ncbi:MAG TPA: GDSL-type esterase/lipase family protein [Planctomycetota bacterium]|jgi:lysophospholipase L1-like esterase
MKTILLSSVLFLSVAGISAESLLKPGDLVAVCGDSITEQKIYSVFIEDYLLMCQPVPRVGTLQFGQGGAAAYVLGKRTPGNLELFRPTVATMMFGMNDGQYRPLNDERATNFRKGTNQSIAELKRIGVRTIVVGSPSCVEWVNKLDDTRMYNTTLASLGDISRDVAQQQGLVFADVQACMRDAIAKGKAACGAQYNFGGDGVHVGPSGHLMIAYAFLRAIGCDGDIGTINVDLAANKATATSGHTVLSFDKGTLQVESTRYPFCFEGDPKKPDAPTTAGVLGFLPFNEDLNRFVLVVHGLKSGKAKVTWGPSSREFAAADLEKGVNLAAAFVPENPFSKHFGEVHAAVLEKQTLETMLTVTLLNNVENIRRLLPDQGPNLETITKSGCEQRQRLMDALPKLLTPVQHTLSIEPLP